MNIEAIRATLNKGTLHTPDDGTMNPEEYHAMCRDRTHLDLGMANAVVFPADVSELQRVIKVCRIEGIPIVPSGGRTGYVGGACAGTGTVVISMTRMNRLISFDPSLPSLRVEAGMITAHVQQEAEARGYYFPVDFASAGSSTIGGNAATNAGGIRVIRYGNMRHWITGMSVVTGDGEVLRFHGEILKDNTGYDLKQLFIGSEGTLGIIADVTVRLTVRPHPPSVYLMALPGFGASIHLLEALRKTGEGAEIMAFEYFDAASLKAVQSHLRMPDPFPHPYQHYILLEIGGFLSEERIHRFFDEGWIVDAIKGESSLQIRQLRAYREGISESISFRPIYKNDISVPLSAMEIFIKRIGQMLEDAPSEIVTVLFGHLGDGNLHLNLYLNEHPENRQPMSRSEFEEYCQRKEKEIYPLLVSLGGSISAEHGIGILKQRLLPYSRSESDLRYMRSIKRVFDPDTIMNRGKIFTNQMLTSSMGNE